MLFACFLAVVANGIWLVWLVKCLEPEEVDTPIEKTTDSRLPVCLHVVIACFGRAGIGATGSWPAGLFECSVSDSILLLSWSGEFERLTAVHEFDLVQATGDFLDVTKSLSHVVKVCLGSIGDFLVLPVGKAVGETDGCKYMPT